MFISLFDQTGFKSDTAVTVANTLMRRQYHCLSAHNCTCGLHLWHSTRVKHFIKTPALLALLHRVSLCCSAACSPQYILSS